jgi:hypothetical protein
MNSSRVGIDKRGSKPSSEMGGSVKGDVQSLIRPRRRGSMKASSAVDPDASSIRYKMNCRIAEV